MYRGEHSGSDDKFQFYESPEAWINRMLNHAFEKMYQRKLQERWREEELERVRKLEEKTAAIKRRLLNREKLSDIQSVDNLEKELEQEIESIPQSYMDAIEEEDEELANTVAEEIEELDIENIDGLSQELEEEFEIQHLQITDGWKKREAANIKSRKMGTKAAPVHVSVAMPAMSVANRAESAKVKITVGAADVSAGDRTTVVTQGGQMKIADDAEAAEINIALNKVNMELGSNTRIKSVGGGMDLKAVDHTVVNVQVDPLTIKMEDGSKMNVHGVDLEGKYDEAVIQKGTVDIQVGQGAELEIRGNLPKSLRTVKKRDREDEDDDTWIIHVEDTQRVVREDADDRQDVQGIVGQDIVTAGRQAYKNFRHDRLIFWEKPNKWLNRTGVRETFEMKFSNKILMVDLNGRHDVQTLECMCQTCQSCRLPRRDTYIQQGFWPVREGTSEMIVDMDLLHLFTSIQVCSRHVPHTRYVNVLRNFFKAKGGIKKPSEVFYTALVKALGEFCGQEET